MGLIDEGSIELRVLRGKHEPCRLRLSPFGISKESRPSSCSFESWLLAEGMDHETERLPCEGDVESLFSLVTAAAACALDKNRTRGRVDLAITLSDATRCSLSLEQLLRRPLVSLG